MDGNRGDELPMRNVKNSLEDHKGREGRRNGKKSERETNHERLWTPGTKQGYRWEGFGDVVAG